MRRRAVLVQPLTHGREEERKRAALHVTQELLKAQWAQYRFFLLEGQGFYGFKEEYLGYLFVVPERQGQGVGKNLLDIAETEIRLNHASAWLFSHPYAETFYEGAGYVKTRETSAPFDFPLYQFQKSLI